MFSFDTIQYFTTNMGLEMSHNGEIIAGKIRIIKIMASNFHMSEEPLRNKGS